MMEPSTSSNGGSKRSRRVLYNKKQVLDLLLGDSSEVEALYEDSGSDYEAPYKFSNSNHASLHRHISPTFEVGGLGKVKVNFFPKAIATWHGRESNPRPPDLESDALTTPPRCP
ncbi:hypothetical protein ElyMa_001469900 [Elysia marginata]|uniref:Uncharacterized protein n=1 Tax=Elysia marginata TaxID=1093978 RepID=A0AAV4J0J5_9GAST|nr:hypothetical protein ElyMa_001469900 [Elysia marginata]